MADIYLFLSREQNRGIFFHKFLSIKKFCQMLLVIFSRNPRRKILIVIFLKMNNKMFFFF